MFSMLNITSHWVEQYTTVGGAAPCGPTVGGAAPLWPPYSYAPAVWNEYLNIPEYEISIMNNDKWS